MPKIANLHQSEPSQSPPRVFKTTANNGLTEESPEMLPRNLRALSLKMAQPKKKLQSLDKRLAEARMNAAASNVSNGVQNFDDYQLTQDRFSNAEQGAHKPAAPLTAIDWGPDPEPVYSSHLNRSLQMSRDNSITAKDSLWGIDDAPYNTMAGGKSSSLVPHGDNPTHIKLREVAIEPKRTMTTQFPVRSRQKNELD